ncbi:MAG: DUF4124 domain-containing protein [Chromatiaceae bacterium]|nr:DUF4124 domain-containing protein [Chromatiaceae bacterium]
MPRRPLLILLGLATIALPALAAKDYHLWYDENGQAVYSQFAPGEGRESEIVKPPPPPAESPEVAQQRLQQQLQKFEDNREDQELTKKKSAEANSEAQLARQRCESAKENLRVLNGPPRQLYQTPDGKVIRMAEEDRQKKRAEMEQIIAKDCK